jgi:ADP-ribosyl-[dinitrogen reductase] hydrolase
VWSLKLWKEASAPEPDGVFQTFMITRKSRFLGSLAGLAVGDAVGTTVEFRSRGSFLPVNDMVGGGPFSLEPGEWTDDTSMALCLGQSLIERHGFDALDQQQRYLRWWKEGYMSSNGRCFDIGNTVRSALCRFEKTGEPYSGSSDAFSAGNGSIMRLAPVPMFYLFDPAQALEKSALSSRTTHQALPTIDACRFFGGLIIGALRGESKETLLAKFYSPVPNAWEAHPLCKEISDIARGSFHRKSEMEIRGSGYVVRSLEAALWAFATTDSFEEGCLKAVNLGEDADTTAAVYGQLAGAFYGYENIPAKWREKLAKRDIIEGIAEGLYGVGNRPHGNCYWVEQDRLMAGEYPGHSDEATAREKVRRAVECGVSFFLDLTEEGESNLKPYCYLLPATAPNGKKVEHVRFPIRDLSLPSKELMKQILATIERALAQEHAVYVHCWGGVGRTGTVLGCWLQRSGVDGETALQQVSESWKAMSESKRQRPPQNHRSSGNIFP